MWRTALSIRAREISPRSTAAHDRVDRARRIARLEQNVGAGLHGEHAALFRRVALADALHRHRVGDRHAAEAERVAKQTGDDARRERRRSGAVALRSPAARCAPS